MLKNNKIYNVDSTKFLKKISDNSIDLIITDPPYGINYYTNRRKTKTRGTENGILNDRDNLLFLDGVLKELYRVLKPGRHIYWFGRFDSISKQIPLFEKHGFIIKNNLIWIKNNHGTGDLYYSYAPKYECILYAIKPGKTKFKLKEVNGIKRHPDTLFFDKISSNLLIHDHEKPTELLEFLIKKSSNTNETILDPFIGSGQTALAAIFQDRKIIGMELDKRIWKMATNRFKRFTKNEIKIGNNFAKIINANYTANNTNNIFDIDGKLKINDKIYYVDLQELNYKPFIEKGKLVFDIISVFYFLDKSLKNKKTFNYDKFKELRNDNKIKISKLGKIYNMNKEDIYLIYINKNNISENSNLNKFKKYEDKNYVYFPFFVKDLKNYIKENKNKLKIIINNKKELKDTWESAYTLIDIEDIYNLIINFTSEQELNLTL